MSCLLQEPMVGAYGFSSKKAARGHADCGRCMAHMFVMHVAEELTTWPESTERQRVWVSLTDSPQTSCTTDVHE